MKGSEAQERQVLAAERSAEAAERTAAAAEAHNRPVRSSEPNPGYPPFRRLFGSERGAVALLRSLPGFAQLWERAVPDGYLRRVRSRDGALWWIVDCPCDEHPALLPGALADCACGRWYFATGLTVRIKRFELEAA